MEFLFAAAEENVAQICRGEDVQVQGKPVQGGVEETDVSAVQESGAQLLQEHDPVRVRNGRVDFFGDFVHAAGLEESAGAFPGEVVVEGDPGEGADVVFQGAQELFLGQQVAAEVSGKEAFGQVGNQAGFRAEAVGVFGGGHGRRYFLQVEFQGGVEGHDQGPGGFQKVAEAFLQKGDQIPGLKEDAFFQLAGAYHGGFGGQEYTGHEIQVVKMGVYIIVIIIRKVLAADAEEGDQPGQALQVVILLGAQEAAVVVDADQLAELQVGPAADEGRRQVQGLQMLRLGNNVQEPFFGAEGLEAEVVDG